MANWFTRAVDKITPWDRGGEVQRRQERKKREEEEQGYNQPAPSRAPQQPGGLQVTQSNSNQRVSVDGFEPKPPKPQEPVNVFEDLNKGFSLRRPSNAVDIINREANKPVNPPRPGTVVAPSQSRSKITVDNRGQDRRVTLPNGRSINTTPAVDTAEQIINRGFDAGKSFEQIAKENRYDLNDVKNYAKSARPNYGVKVERPDQSLFDRFVRDRFDANTQADQFRRQEGNRLKGEDKNVFMENPGNIISQLPVVGFTAKALNTIAAQVASLPAQAKGFYLQRKEMELTDQIREALDNGNNILAQSLSEQRDAVFAAKRDVTANQEAFYGNFQDNKGGIINSGTLFDEAAARKGSTKDQVIGTSLDSAVAGLDAYTLGKGNLISKGLTDILRKQGLKTAATTGIRSQTGNIAKTAGGNFASGGIDAASNGAGVGDISKASVINATAGTLPDILLPFIGKSLRLGRRAVNPAARTAAKDIDTAAIDASVENFLKETAPKPIPVRQNIPISGAASVPEGVAVRNMTEPKRLIKEFPGDETLATPNPLIRQAAQEVKDEAAIAANNASKPSQAAINKFEGVTPRGPEAPFKLDENTTIKTQGDAISEYAKFLKEVGQGNGVDLIPDGEAFGTGMKRVSNNVRFGDTKGKRMTKAMWEDEARRQLEAGIADPSIQKAFNDAADPEVQSLLAKGEQTPTSEGAPIKVKSVNGIDVIDNTDVPQNLPETPGAVRTSTSKAPSNIKSEKVAAQSPISLPKETQAILDNPKQYNKRQVAAARNQRKLARDYAKAQEQTSEYYSKAETSKKARTGEVADENTGFAPTGEFKKGKNGNISETATRATEAAQANKEMATKSVDEVLEQVKGKKRLEPADFRQLEKSLETIKNANPKYADLPEYRKLRDSLNAGKSDVARQMGLMQKISRRISTGDTLANRWENKISQALDDNTKLNSDKLGQIQTANNRFADLRDNAARLEEQYKKSPSTANLESFKSALKAAEEADMAAKNLEVRVAKDTLKGSKAENAARVINDLEREAELNMMDYMTASQLSGPATGMRNLYGTELAGVENRIGANTRAGLTHKVFNNRLMNKKRPGEVNVGGYSAKGGAIGRKEGFSRMVGDASNRTKYSGFNPFKQSRNFATTVNSLGESSIHAQKQSRLLKYYENQARAKGLTGQNLKNDAEFLRLTDPDGMGEVFMDSVMKSSGLSGIYKKTQKFETNMAAQIASKLGNVLPPNAADKISKGVTRVAFGYPTATGNFVLQSGKRATLGVPSFIESGVKALRGEKQAAALAFDRGLKEAGSGAAAIGTGMMLSKANLISGFYPEDKDERQRWADEGKSELSIKIGDTWHPIPQGFGMFGLPLLVGSLLESGGPEEVTRAFTNRENLFKLSPADQTKSFLEVLSGGSTENQDKSFVASTIRSIIPAGSFLNQTTKGLDDTVNDTTTKDFWSNVRDQVLTGLPGGDKLSDIPDKISSTGEPIKNPSLLQSYAGAKSVEQKEGVENSNKVDKEINEALKNIDKYGLLSDPNMKDVLEGTGLEASVKANAGRQLDESEIKALQKNLVKGVSSEGTDTAYLEREQYDTNLSVLKLKKELMESDPTTKPSSLEDIDTAIKRGEIYKKEKTPYQDITDYKSTGVKDWRKMGIPPGDKNHDEDMYDPEMYEKLWQLDQKMTEAGVSYNTKGKEKNKYYLKEKKGSGKGGRGGGGRGSSLKISGDFGKLREGKFAPRVQQYSTIDTKARSVPVIGVKRPNIVNKITQGR